MSSVAGVQPLHDGSEETLDHVCDPCNFRGLQREGSSYCKNCQENLCQTCADVHKGQKISRNHDLVSVSKLVMKAILRQETNSKFLCDCNQNSEVVVYCQTHDDVICRSCAVTKHRTCKTVPIGEKCALYPKENFADVVLKANKVNVETDQLLNERRSDLKSYFAMTEIAKEDMRKYRQEINQQFDMMERAILTELEDRESRNRKVVEDHILSYTTTQQLIQADLKILNDIEKTNNKADMFAADVKVSKRLTEHEGLLREIHREAKSPSLTFRKNDQLVDMLIKIKNIGALVEHTIVTERKAKSVFTDMKVENLSQKNIKISSDWGAPGITGCVFMSDGRLILSDNRNKNLKLFDKSFTRQETIDLTSRPCGMSLFNDTTALITLPYKKQLQYIEVAPTLKLGRTLQLDKKCWGVRVVGSDIYVTCHRDYWGGDGEVRILDKNGNLRNRLGVNHDKTFMFKKPYDLTVSARSNKIYVSDSDQHTLTCLKSDGTVVFQYKDPELNWPRGVCVDDEDNVIVCGWQSNNIHVVTAAGKKHDVILTSKDGISKPTSVAYRQFDHTFIVGNENGDSLIVEVKCVTKLN